MPEVIRRQEIYTHRDTHTRTRKPGLAWNNGAMLMVKSGKDKRHNFQAKMERINMSQIALKVAEIAYAKAKGKTKGIPVWLSIEKEN